MESLAKNQSNWGGGLPAILLLLFLLIISSIGASGCVGGGPHLSFESRSERPSETPTGRVDMDGAGAGMAESESFKAYGSTTYVYGGRGSSEKHRMLSPEMTMGKMKVRAVR